jgi:glycosyltransferase involved in cell wall biosynthesis
MLRIAFRLCDHVVAVSNGQAAWLRAANLVPADRLTSIPQSLNLTGLNDLPEPATSGLPLRLGAYGRYVEQKGFDVLLKAMRIVPSTMAQLAMAGYGPDEAALRAEAADLSNVHIGGKTNGPADFLSTVDVVVVPSRWEAYGLVAQEARAAGRPLIASGIDGLVEQVDESWGVLVASNDPASLADAIMHMATMDRRSMSVLARVSAVNSFERKIDAWRALYARLAPQP